MLPSPSRTGRTQRLASPGSRIFSKRISVRSGPNEQRLHLLFQLRQEHVLYKLLQKTGEATARSGTGRKLGSGRRHDEGNAFDERKRGLEEDRNVECVWFDEESMTSTTNPDAGARIGVAASIASCSADQGTCCRSDDDLAAALSTRCLDGANETWYGSFQSLCHRQLMPLQRSVISPPTALPARLAILSRPI